MKAGLSSTGVLKSPGILRQTSQDYGHSKLRPISITLKRFALSQHYYAILNENLIPDQAATYVSYFISQLIPFRDHLPPFEAHLDLQCLNRKTNKDIR